MYDVIIIDAGLAGNNAVKGRILFAGEAVGFLNPMGEGISVALESGYAAAAVRQVDLSGRFDVQEIHDTYKENTKNLKIYIERQ